MKSRTRDGVKLCYVEDGSGGAPFVFVHGWCCDHTYFAPQHAHFARDHRVVSVDQRGFGQSDRPEQSYPIEGFADDLAWLCRELRLERPLIVGHSLGGAVALATAARHPDLPRAIALCDPAVVFPAGLGEGTRAFVAALAGPGYREAARGFIDGQMFSRHDDPVRRARIVADMCATPQGVMRSAFEGVLSFDSDAAARACRVPVLLIDAEAPIADRARFATLCPQLEVAQTAGAGHFHQLEVPDQVNAMLERFAQGVDLDKRAR